MIAIPVIGDQFRNAQLLKRTGAGWNRISVYCFCSTMKNNSIEKWQRLTENKWANLATIYNKFDLAKTSRFEDAVRAGIDSKEWAFLSSISCFFQRAHDWKLANRLQKLLDQEMVSILKKNSTDWSKPLTGTRWCCVIDHLRWRR